MQKVPFVKAHENITHHAYSAFGSMTLISNQGIVYYIRGCVVERICEFINTVHRIQMTIPMYEISFCLTFSTAFYACVQNVVSKPNEPKAAIPWTGLSWHSTIVAFRLGLSPMVCCTIIPSVLLLGGVLNLYGFGHGKLLNRKTLHAACLWAFVFVAPTRWPSLVSNPIYVAIFNSLFRLRYIAFGVNARYFIVVQGPILLQEVRHLDLTCVNEDPYAYNNLWVAMYYD